jgi:Skp family chaperone for outer membrane proteins
MKKLIRQLLLLSLLAVPTLKNIAAPVEVGLIDESRLLTEYTASKNAQDKIADLRTKMQDLLTELNAGLEKVSTDKTLTEVQKTQKQKDAEKKFVTEREKAEAVAASLRDKVEADVQKAITEEAKAQSLALVVSKEVTFYGGKDITDPVLKRLNSAK